MVSQATSRLSSLVMTLLPKENVLQCAADTSRESSVVMAVDRLSVTVVQEQFLIGGQIRKIVQHILQKRFDMSG